MSNHYFITNMPFINEQVDDPAPYDLNARSKPFRTAGERFPAVNDWFNVGAKGQHHRTRVAVKAAQEKLERPSEPDIDQRLEEPAEQAGGEEVSLLRVKYPPDRAQHRDDVNSVWLENYIDQIAGESFILSHAASPKRTTTRTSRATRQLKKFVPRTF
jgi:hypothetical protein